MVNLVVAFVAKHWKWFAIGAAVISIFAGFQIVEAQRDRWEAEAKYAQEQRDRIAERLEVSNNSVDALQGAVVQQNEAFLEMERESQRRIEEGQRNVMEVIRQGVSANKNAEELTESAGKGGDQSETSASLMNMRDSL